jgi:tripartite-type tricarboxylate transporter receptor subunit TctC
MIESGIAGFEMSSWQAVYAPKNTPKAIVNKLNARSWPSWRCPM